MNSECTSQAHHHVHAYVSRSSYVHSGAHLSRLRPGSGDVEQLADHQEPAENQVGKHGGEWPNVVSLNIGNIVLRLVCAPRRAAPTERTARESHRDPSEGNQAPPAPAPGGKADELRRSQASTSCRLERRAARPTGCNPTRRRLQPCVISTGRLDGRVAEVEAANASAAAAASCGALVSGTCRSVTPLMQ